MVALWIEEQRCDIDQLPIIPIGLPICLMPPLFWILTAEMFPADYLTAPVTPVRFLRK